MKYINENEIFNIIKQAENYNEKEVIEILDKAKKLNRLSLKETAILLSVKEKELLNEIFNSAKYIKNKIYGKRVVLFAPLYISNYCVNHCVYCGFNCTNKETKRKALNIEEIKEQTLQLLKRGHMRILLVTGEGLDNNEKYINYLCDAIKAIYSVEFKGLKIKRININCAPLTKEHFQKLKDCGIGTYQLFQETYHEETYRKVHLKGPKSDADLRISALDKAFSVGIDDVGIGILFGLYDYKFEILAMLQHIEYLEKNYGVGPHTISVPRMEAAEGSDFASNPPCPPSDDDFRKIVAILRLAVPYTGLILSTRESAESRNELIDLGISQISAESCTSPGGYSDNDKSSAQFEISDKRSLDEIVDFLMTKDYTPSFCAACYRKGRTGDVFMHIAKPGNIKNKCEINSILTLKEYLMNFATKNTKEQGEIFIKKSLSEMDDETKEITLNLLKKIENGEKDIFV